MKILLATDGSPYSEGAIAEVIRRPWPEGSQVKVLTVIHVVVPQIPDPFLVIYAAHEEQLQEARKLAPQNVEKAAQQIREACPDLEVKTEVIEGSPKKAIVKEAKRWGADLILVGSHGYGAVESFVLGSVSHAVALHAPCSVEIVRLRGTH